MKVDDLDPLIRRWESVCGSVTISIGDGMTADYADDLYEGSKFEVDHLVIRTEDPSITITLRANQVFEKQLGELPHIASLAALEQ